MEARRPCSCIVLCIFFAHVCHAFVVTSRCSFTPGPATAVTVNRPSRRSFHEASSTGLSSHQHYAYLPPRPRAHGSPTSMSTSSWSSEERVEIVRSLVEWQEKDAFVAEAGIKILTDSTPTAGLLIMALL